VSTPLRSELDECGTLLRLTLDRPKGNVLDAEMISALRQEITRARDWAPVRTLLLSGEGRHFSFGASVEEHQPQQVDDMLKGFHALFRELLDSGLVTLAAVRGQCLGGGLELAAFCQRVFAAPDAKLGQPEVKLGVFAPVASVILPLRVGQANADDLLLTGRSVNAEEALRMGLVDALSDDPVQAAVDWHLEHLHGLSGAAVHFAARAARARLRRALSDDLATVEGLYLSDLMATHDAPEGIASFLEKREPQWTNR
jgi:cyclohexa-1,5-dienecarbonyl-CoA hydratase